MGLNDNSNEEEYRFVEEHVVSRKHRIRRFFGKILHFFMGLLYNRKKRKDR